ATSWNSPGGVCPVSTHARSARTPTTARAIRARSERKDCDTGGLLGAGRGEAVDGPREDVNGGREGVDGLAEPVDGFGELDHGRYPAGTDDQAPDDPGQYGPDGDERARRGAGDLKRVHQSAAPM